MPYFDENPLLALATQACEAEATLDLQGLSAIEALARVDALLAGTDRRTTYLIHFDAAADDGRETLFLPLGRRLLQARRDGTLKHCLPAPDGTGYFIAFATDVGDHSDS